MDGRKPLEGEEDVRRMDVFINAVDRQGNVEAVVNFDHGEGPGEYFVTGKYDMVDQTLRFLPGTDAWNTDYPVGVVARELSGRLGDDGEFFTGLVKPSTECSCVGPLNTPTTNKFPETGSVCKDWTDTELPDRKGEWCYVKHTCSEAVEDPQARGHYWKRCGNEQTCTSFRMTRVCSDATALCDQGWTEHGGRCFKNFPEKKTFFEAGAACDQFNASLVSIHNLDNNAFVLNLHNESESWVGAAMGSQGAFEWEDKTKFEFVDWAKGEPSAAKDCVIQGANGRWTAADCTSTANTFTCRKLPLGRDLSCECNGESDEFDLGGHCQEWDVGQRAWCHVSHNCPRAVEDPQSKMWQAFCYDGRHSTTTSTTTTGPPTTTPETNLNCKDQDPNTFQTGGACVKCLDSCVANQYLMGECEEFSGPSCKPCDDACNGCTGGTDKLCSDCADGFFRLLDSTKRCVKTCPPHTYQDDSTKECVPCAATCDTCTGPGENACKSCLPGGSLFLDSKITTCVGECPDGTFASVDDHMCKACTVCGAGSFAAVPCEATVDAKCQSLSVCNPRTEFELTAPTSTSDRRCKTVRSCRVGQFVAAEPTTTSDRECVTCPAGFTDHDFNPNSACLECGAKGVGYYLPESQAPTQPWGRGPCLQFVCKPGTADKDSDPSTPCEVCNKGTEYQDTAGQTECIKATCAAGEEGLGVSSTQKIQCRSCIEGLTFKAAEGPEQCARVATCKAGEEDGAPPTVTSDRECSPCDAGFFKADAGVGKCQAWTKCRPGEQPDNEPTATVNQVCSGCKSGQWSDGGFACTPWTVCAADEWEEEAPTNGNDRKCTLATVCSEDEYESASLRERSDRECTLMTVCADGEFEDVAPRKNDDGAYISDRSCATCSVCGAGNDQISPCGKKKDTQCGSCGKKCKDTEYEKVPCESTQPRVCEACISCKDTEYEKTPCSARAQTVCDDLSVCDPDEFELLPPGKQSDRVCQRLTVCQRGEFVLVEPTATNDRVCGECVLESTFSDEENAAKCQDIVPCLAGQEEVEPATLTSQPKCVKCDLTKTYKPEAGPGKCMPVRPECVDGEFENQPPTLTSNRVCGECREGQFLAGTGGCQDIVDCEAGKYEAEPPTPTSQRVCQSCPSFQFTTGAPKNPSECTPFTRCGPGMYRAGGSATEDVTCNDCETGTFKRDQDDFDASVASVCKDHTECQLGEEEVSPASASADRECRPCEAGTFNIEKGTGVCTPWQTCEPGFEPDSSATPSLIADRVCRKCGIDAFKAERGNTNCGSVSNCPAGSRIKDDYTSRQDRTCAPCKEVRDDGTVLSTGYSTKKNSEQCDPHSVCEAGEEVIVEPSDISDRKCQKCARGWFSTGFNAQACKKWTVCAKGERQTLAPSSSADRECAPCNADPDNPTTFSDTRNSLVCKPFRSCQIGQETLVAGTSTSNRKCTNCEVGKTFSTKPNSPECTPVSECQDGLVETVKATRFADRKCGLPPKTTTLPPATTGAASGSAQGSGADGSGASGSGGSNTGV